MLSQLFQPPLIISSQLQLILLLQMMQFLTQITVSSWRNEVDICSSSNGTELLVIQWENPTLNTAFVILNISIFPVSTAVFGLDTRVYFTHCGQNCLYHLNSLGIHPVSSYTRWVFDTQQQVLRIIPGTRYCALIHSKQLTKCLSVQTMKISLTFFLIIIHKTSIFNSK